jgi:hypothetical protein
MKMSKMQLFTRNCGKVKLACGCRSRDMVRRLHGYGRLKVSLQKMKETFFSRILAESPLLGSAYVHQGKVYDMSQNIHCATLHYYLKDVYTLIFLMLITRGFFYLLELTYAPHLSLRVIVSMRALRHNFVYASVHRYCSYFVHY